MTIKSQALRDSAGHPDAHCWRPVVGWEGLYEVSSDGRVRSVERVMPCSNGKRRRCKSIELRQSLSAGYLRVQLCRSGQELGVLVHRVVAEAFIPGVGSVVRHLDGSKSDNSVGNICWGSQKQNIADKEAHGTKLFGATHPQATITEKEVVQIRGLYAQGLSKLEVGRRMSLPRGVVEPILRGQTWRHVQ